MKFQKLLVVCLFSFLVLVGVFSEKPRNEVFAQAANVGYLTGYAWSENIGWISFATSTNGNNLVTVDSSGAISGYAWSENIGWIKFGGLSGFPAGGGNASLSGNSVTGWARACAGTANGDCSTMTSRTDGWDGWIALSGSGYGVNLSGSPSYAWGSDVIGWIDWQPSYGGVTYVPTFVCSDTSDTVAAEEGGTINYTIGTGGTVISLPTGLSYNASTGVISGIINNLTSDPQSFTARVSFTTGSCTYTKTVTFSVSCPLSGGGQCPDQTATIDFKAKRGVCSAPGSLSQVDPTKKFNISVGGSICLDWSIQGDTSNQCGLTKSPGAPGSDFSNGNNSGQNKTIGPFPAQGTYSYTISCPAQTKKVEVFVIGVEEF